ncbi:cytochrome c oxidase assembly protein CtaG [Kordiimonas sediminis]|uniref:Cytochrome c oxidase assembly protein CtaG n=1 Tax=Kordiimonas sediminis TaxID=1735581 RepID=A0A919AZ35_9PROT|nr:cytochrome c oxidase assembly protein [Kordiimonas sediminis]GHF30152.1 cytochrome c oxidase assembly protein CtaG [Kordiimonas sediminis]
MTQEVQQPTYDKNKKVAGIVFGVVVGMVGMSYAAVPLYDLFCKVTGYGGTTQQADTLSAEVIDRDMRVRFNASVHKDMPWEFKPAQNTQMLKVGEQGIAYYEAYNPTDKIITGTATYNVAPHKAGGYFTKIDCFCFTEQVLKPGEKVLMPVVYYIDPEIDQDVNLNEVGEITLSYTFFVRDNEDMAENR